MDKTVGIIGLGKMGANVARRLSKKGWKVVGYNRTPEKTQELENEGVLGVYSLEDLVSKLNQPRVIISLLPSGAPTDEMIENLLPLLSQNDIFIEMANSFYKETQRRGKTVTDAGVKFIDVGISGGPGGALNGACLMVGGDKELFEYLNPLFTDMAKEGAVAHFPGIGAGHFVKMVHNGIEYGMMESIAEGYAILKDSEYHPDLLEVSKIYNNGSVIDSRLTHWLQEGFEKYGANLEELSGSVGFNGEGEWTAQVGEEMGIDVRAIRDAVDFRKDSQEKPSFAGKILTAMRNMFGGHSIERGKMT